MLRFFIAPLLRQQTCVPAWSPLSSYGLRSQRGWTNPELASRFRSRGLLRNSGQERRRDGLSVTLHSERSQEVENGLLVRHRQLPELLHHRIRLGRREIVGRTREML